MIYRKLVFFSLVILLLSALAPIHAAQAPTPKNVILLIGDGMGPAQVSLARLSLGDALMMDSMPCGGLVKTHSASSTFTDSAAAATALATGFKTNNGMIAVLPDGRQVQTILEAASELGKATGLVTTVTITHATPAGFGAHVNSRGDEADIAPQYLDKKINVLLGGGRQFFIPQSEAQSKRKDDRNLIAEAKSAGYEFVDAREAMLSAKGSKLLGLFQMSSMTTEAPEPTLSEMADKAISVLAADKDGFFVMIEGGQIDYKCHANDGPATVKQVLDFDAAVGKALDFARKRTDTLVIVTADHETGGLTIVYPDKGEDAKFKAKFSTTGHSACNVPFLAFGPGASQFGGVMDNTDIPKRIACLWGVKDFAKDPQ